MIAYFANVLKLNGGEFEGLPFVLQGWQSFIVGSLFGWQRIVPAGEPPKRRFKTGFVLTGKGNGKSPLAAGIGLYCLTSDGESRAEVYARPRRKIKRWCCSETPWRCATCRPLDGVPSDDEADQGPT